MGFTPPVLQKIGFDKTGPETGFITVGTSGITTIRWQTTGGYVYDMTVTDAGAVLTTLVSSPSSTYYYSLWGLLANVE